MNALTLLGISTASLFMHLPKNAVWVTGEIHTPGVFAHKEGMRMMDALSLARGELPRRTDIKNIRVLRRTADGTYKSIQVNLIRFMVKPFDQAPNIELMPGDWIVFPKQARGPVLGRKLAPPWGGAN